MSSTTSGSIVIQLYGGDYDTVVPLAGSDDGQWHHYCVAYDGSAWTLYFDGASAKTVTVTLDTGSVYVLMLGDRVDQNGPHSFDGAIDEVYVYSSALDAASIQVLYDFVTVAPTVTPLPTHHSHSTLVAHYSFDDGTAADDAVGDGSLDGTITGATMTTGLFGSGALAFDGSGNYVEFPTEVTADILGSSARTVCLWAVIDDWDLGALFSLNQL